MPYDPERDEYYWGETFSEENYDPNAARPRLSQAVRVLRHKGEVFSMLVTGKMGSPHKKMSGITKTVTIEEIEKYAFGQEQKGEAERKAEQEARGGKFSPARLVSGGQSLEEKIQDMFGLNTRPEHVTGLFFHVLDR